MLTVTHTGTVMDRYHLPEDATMDEVVQMLWIGIYGPLDEDEPGRSIEARALMACASEFLVFLPGDKRNGATPMILEIGEGEPTLYRDMSDRSFDWKEGNKPVRSKSCMVVSEWGP